ncbi:zinc knuckle CX2CX4HX4C containing protein [Tanacetum coccineum]
MIKDINKVLKDFLWGHGDSSKGSAKVSWKIVCKTKAHSGIGLKYLSVWNKALLVKHIWNIAIKKDTLWVKWVGTVKLKEGSIWVVQKEDVDSPLINKVNHRSLYDARVDKNGCVAAMLDNGIWIWLTEWYDSFPIITNITNPVLSHIGDKVTWVGGDGTTKNFSMKQVYEIVLWKFLTEMGNDLQDSLILIWFMENSDKLNVREGISGNHGAVASGASCGGSQKESNSSPLVSSTAIISMPRGQYNVDVAATFGVPLTTVGDLDVLTKDIEVGKHKELLLGMTNDKRKVVMDALVAMCNSIEAENTHLRSTCPTGSIPMKVFETVSTRFDNTLYGYFISKRVAFPIVEYYVRNNWGKFGLTRIMMNSKGSFFFKFKTTKGLEDVLENGPWMIRNSPIILKKWAMNTRLCKEEFTRIRVWVKIYDVPLQVFSEDGISIIASHIGKPIMLDSYTISMCIESWGRSSFARCLIEVSADDVFKDTLTMGVIRS